MNDASSLPPSLARYLDAPPANPRDYPDLHQHVLALARAGLLDGHAATTHWAFVACLQRFPNIQVDTTHQRYIVSGNRLTGGGISSGLDEALQLISLLFGTTAAMSVQVTTQYFPRPPVAGVIPSTPKCMIDWG